MKRPWPLTCLIYFGAMVVAMFTLAPLVWLFVMSVSSTSDLTAIPLHFLPETFDWSRYTDLLGITGNLRPNPFLHGLKNSLVAAGGSTLLALLAGIPAAYGFARRGGPNWLLFAMLATYMMPPITYILPLYGIFGDLGMLNSPVSLVAVYCTMLLPFATWLFKSNLDVLPEEVEWAATLEGASTLCILRRVVLPMARPALIAAALLSFLIAWDEFFYALLFSSDFRGKTLPVTVADFAAGRVTDYGRIAALGVLASLPPTLLAMIFQKYLVHGLAAGGVKG